VSITVLDPGGHPIGGSSAHDGAGILRPQIGHSEVWDAWHRCGGAPARGTRPAIRRSISALAAFPRAASRLPEVACDPRRQGNLLRAIGVSGDRPEHDESVRRWG